MPLGTRGGTKFTHTFPADGEYRISIAGDLGAGLYPRAVETRHTLVVLVDRKEQYPRRHRRARRISRRSIAGGAPARAELMKRFTDIPLQVTAGTHEIVVTFIERSRAADDEQIGGGSGDFSFGGAGARAGHRRRRQHGRAVQLDGPHADREPPQAVRLRAGGRRTRARVRGARSRRTSRAARFAGP